jgi:hypothetical protein
MKPLHYLKGVPETTQGALLLLRIHKCLFIAAGPSCILRVVRYSITVLLAKATEPSSSAVMRQEQISNKTVE